MIRETGIKIKDILDKEIFKNSVVLAGRAGLDNKITKINVMVDPDILEFVKMGEFLLTTSYYFLNSTLEEQEKLIREISKNSLSGMGIKVKPHLKELPKEIIELADSLKLPIIEINHEISFTDVMAVLYGAIFDNQSHIIRKVEKVHNDTMNSVLRGGTIFDIIENLAETIGNPIVIKDLHFEETIYSSKVNKDDKKIISEDLDSLNYVKKKKIPSTATINDWIIVENREIERLIVPIIVKNNIYGFLAAYGMWKSVMPFDSLYLESVSPIIAMEFIKKISVQEVENKYKTEFFEDLISLDERRKLKAVERSSYYRLEKNAYYNILSIKFEKTEEIKDEEFNQNMIKAMYLIDLICKDRGRNFLRANKGRKVYVLFMWDEKNGEKIDESAEVANQIKEVLSLKIIRLKFRIGIGRAYYGIENVYKSLRDSEKAIDASIAYIDDDIIKFDNLGIYKIFCQDNLKDELIDFYEGTLKPLVNYDRKRDTELVKSLGAYFETNGNLKKMSELLFTHYNTVLYRINRIQEITNKSLDNESHRYGLQTALKIMKILNL